jgi:hypothetical protein
MDDETAAREGMDVIGDDGGKLGEVTATSKDSITVERGLLRKHEVEIPAEYVREVEGDDVKVSITSVEISAMAAAAERREDQQSDVGSPGAASNVAEDDGGGINTTMTGVGYGAGAGASSGGPLDVRRGDQIDDRLGGSGRAGLGASDTFGGEDIGDADERLLDRASDGTGKTRGQ